MTVEQYGFFKEIEGDADAISIESLVSESPQSDEEKIVRYLRNGNVLMVSPSLAMDHFDPNKSIGGRTILTDGYWMWPSELAYYVENYHVRVSDAFVRHMNASAWQVPVMSHEDLLDLEEKLAGSVEIPIVDQN